MIGKILSISLGYALFFLLPLAAAQEKTVFFNKKEKAWLQNLDEPLKVGITMIPNQILVNSDGSYRGFSMDLFALIEKKLHLHFKYVYFESWNALLDAAKSRKIDIVFAAQKTPSRLAYLDFTDTVLTQQNKIIVTVPAKFNSIKALAQRRVAVSEGSAVEEFIEENYPKIVTVPVKTELDALEMLNANAVDAAISEAVRASYYIEKNNLDNLRVADTLAYDYHLNIGSRNDLPYLSVVLSKTVSQIPAEQIKALQLKWGYIKDKIVFFDKQMMIYIAIVFAVVIPFSLYLYVINRRLQKEIRERKKVINELQLMRKSRLSQMSEVVSMIAHQWRQPLNNLSLVMQLLISQYKRGTLDDNALEYFKVNSQKQIDQMSNTIDDFRDFFKVENETSIFDLKETISNILEMIEPIFKNHHINIHFHYDQEERYSVDGYANALSQAIINIVNNAKDALNERDIKDKRIDIWLKKEEKRITIRIKDNAGGIDEDILGKIFDPYFSTKKERNGTGLGLYMSRTIIEEKMAGSIVVTNQDNGAEFVIDLRR